MPYSSLSLGDLEEYTPDPETVSTGTTELTHFLFVFHRDDIGDVEHEGYVEEVSPISTAEFRTVRALENDNWRYFATVNVQDSTWSNIKFLFENQEGEIYDALVERDIGVEILHPVTVNELDY